MSDALQFGILAFTSLLAIVNPLGAVPMYLALTAGYDAQHRRATVRRAVVTALLVLLTFTALGTWILRVFGITTPAFQVAGGILFFGVGWDMLQARRSRTKGTAEEEAESAGRDDVGPIPLGLPGLAGPGSITTVIALNGQTDGVTESLLVYVAVILVITICFIVLSAAPAVTRRMGQTGMNVMTRLMGLLVMVIGAQFVINGASRVVLDLAAQIGRVSQ